MKKSFVPGHTILSPKVLKKVPKTEILTAFRRHLRCDWGDVTWKDKARNYRSLEAGGQLFSVYHSKDGIKFWIITKADRSATTVLLPEDY